MKLPTKFNKLFGQKKEKTKLYLAILFEQARILVAVFSSQEKKASIIAHKSAPYNQDEANAVEIIDRLLGELGVEYPEVDKLEDTIFGFPKEFLTEEGKIKKDKSSGLKDIVKQLSLKPIGFVVISEALAYYFSSKSGTQESAVFAGIATDEIKVSLIKIGKIIEEKNIPRTDNICFDIETAFSGFNQEVLPAKIMLYDSNRDDLDTVKEKLLNHPWDKKAYFLHFPKIEILPSLTTLKAVVGSYTQKINVLSETQEISAFKKQEMKEIKKIQETGQTEQKEHKNVETEKISKRKMPLLKIPKIKFNKRFLLLLPFAGLFIFLIWYAQYKSSVAIKILVDTKTFEQELEFTLNPEVDSVKKAEQIIPGKLVAVELEDSQSKDTEGTKLIGDSAKGNATIYNKTTKEKSFEKGARLLTAKKIAFLLDEDIKIASAEEDIDGITYGKKSVKVTAESIGPEGNIKKETNLVFEDFDDDDYSARSEEDFSGGKSREVSVVSNEDVLSLRKKILSSLSKKAEQKMLEKNDNKLAIIEETLEGEIKKENLSTKIGEQAKSVTLKAVVSYTALAYDPENIVALLHENAKDEFPQGYIFREGLGSQKILEQKINKDSSVNFTASFATKLVPDISEEEIKNEAKGKKISEFEKYLRDKKGIGGFEIVFDNKLPFPSPKSFPSDPSKITISIITR